MGVRTYMKKKRKIITVCQFTTHDSVHTQQNSCQVCGVFQHPKSSEFSSLPILGYSGILIATQSSAKKSELFQKDSIGFRMKWNLCYIGSTERTFIFKRQKKKKSDLTHEQANCMLSARRGVELNIFMLSYSISVKTRILAANHLKKTTDLQ